MVKIKFISNVISQHGEFARNQIVTVDEQVARRWLEQGSAKVYIAPTETKVAGPSEKKSSGEATATRSTASLLSTESGPAEPSSSSEADQASLLTTSPSSSEPTGRGRSRRSQ